MLCRQWNERRRAALGTAVEGEPTSAEEFARALAAGGRIDVPVALVVAHPDDETLWAGTALGRLDRLVLIHATDGAPFDMRDAGALGLEQREEYAALRADELGRALKALNAAPERRGYGVPDQELVNRLGDLVDRLAHDLAGVSAVATHAYEGGHPDHDALAFAVREACRRIRSCGGPAPVIVEFPGYHEVEGGRRFGDFWPDDHCPEHTRVLTSAEIARYDAGIAAHASQAGVVAGWRPVAERWRAAPAYDFAMPPPPGRSLYDGFGWALTSDRWRAQVAAFVAEAQAWV